MFSITKSTIDFPCRLVAKDVQDSFAEFSDMIFSDQSIVISRVDLFYCKRRIYKDCFIDENMVHLKTE